MTTLALRPATDTDTEFLIGVYAGAREQELNQVAWDAEQKDAFIRMQFAAQDSYWREQRPAASFDVVLAGGEPAGRLIVDCAEDEIRIVDVALLERFRSQGIGTSLLADVLAEAERSGRRVTIHVECFNLRARAWYERLGFAQIGSTGVYDLMEWRCS
jgi:ribosomal protein S18 acetylase RimI-like enzyme